MGILRRIIPIRSKDRRSLEAAMERSRRCVERIKTIHRNVIRASGQAHEEGLSDAIYSEAPLQRFCDSRDYIGDDVFMLAANAIESIAVFHPFADGNKRTALFVALQILSSRGYTLRDDENTYRFMRKAATGDLDLEEIADWLRANAVRTS